MELKALLAVFKKNSHLIKVYTLVFALLGFGYFNYFPKTYKATGSLYVTREVDQTYNTDFTYEGYYAQQAGVSYTGTLIGLLESADVRKVVLETVGVNVNEKSLRLFARNIDARKAAPQLVTLTIKALTPELAEAFWILLSETVVEASNNLNNSLGDPLLTVSPVGEFPIVYEGFRDLPISVTVGALSGFLVGLFLSVLKEYLS